MTGRQKTIAAYRHYLSADRDAQVMIRDARTISRHKPLKTLGAILVLPGLSLLLAVLIAMSTGEITSNIIASALVTGTGVVAIAGGVIMQRADDRLVAIHHAAEHLSRTRFNDYLDALSEELRSDGFITRYIDYDNHKIVTNRGVITPSRVIPSATPTLLLDGEPMDSDEIDPSFSI